MLVVSNYTVVVSNYTLVIELMNRNCPMMVDGDCDPFYYFNTCPSVIYPEYEVDSPQSIATRVGGRVMKLPWTEESDSNTANCDGYHESV